MDGSPIKSEVVPVRMYLGQFDLTPTYKNIDGIGSVRYFLDLGLYDEDERRYFKQHEIYLWRDREENLLDKNQSNFISPYFEKLKKELQIEEEAAALKEEKRRRRKEEKEREKAEKEKEKEKEKSSAEEKDVKKEEKPADDKSAEKQPVDPISGKEEEEKPQPSDPLTGP